MINYIKGKIDNVEQKSECRLNGDEDETINQIITECSKKSIRIDITTRIWGRESVVRVFAKSSGDRGTIPVQVIPKTQKMVLDAALLNTQHYMAWIKGKVE